MLRAIAITLILIVVFPTNQVVGQTVPWEVFVDTESASVCGLINAENAELVVLRESGLLVIVTGQDVILENTFVDEEGTVFVDAYEVGYLTFALDGDGFRTLWWVSLTNRAIHIDGITGEASESDYMPTDFNDVPCGACPFWDEQLAACYTPTAILIQPQSQTVCEGEQVTLFVQTEGTDIDAYQWFKNGIEVTGETDSVLFIPSASLFDTATYSVDVIDIDGSRISSDIATLVVKQCAAPPINFCGTQVGLIGSVMLVSLTLMRLTRRRLG